MDLLLARFKYPEEVWYGSESAGTGPFTLLDAQFLSTRNRLGTYAHARRNTQRLRADEAERWRRKCISRLQVDVHDIEKTLTWITRDLWNKGIQTLPLTIPSTIIVFLKYLFGVEAFPREDDTLRSLGSSIANMIPDRRPSSIIPGFKRESRKLILETPEIFAGIPRIGASIPTPDFFDEQPVVTPTDVARYAIDFAGFTGIAVGVVVWVGYFAAKGALRDINDLAERLGRNEWKKEDAEILEGYRWKMLCWPGRMFASTAIQRG